jgi:hypothetical protein
MRAVSAISYPDHALERHRVARPPLASLRARLRAGSLDRELACGVPSWASPLHAARALQLTDRHHRMKLAESLDRIVENASLPGADFIGSAVVPPCRRQVLQATGELLEIASRLRGPSLVAARGVALVVELLCDGAGPCYRCTYTRALTRALRPVARHLGAEE